jgi:hypothetical protein
MKSDAETLQVPLHKRRFAKKCVDTVPKNAGSFQYELARAATFHKVQGITTGKIILDLSLRPQLLGRIDFHSIYVAITRVRKLDDIRLLPSRLSGFGHLLKLERPMFPLLKNAMWLTDCSYSWEPKPGEKRRRK